MNKKFLKGDHVRINFLNIFGIIVGIRDDDNGKQLIDIKLNNAYETPTGYYMARDFEIVHAERN